MRAKVVKNKVAPPFRQAEFYLMYGQGISKEGSLLDLGVEEGIVAKSGSWFTCGEERLGQGREAAKDYLREHTELRDRIESRIREALSIPQTSGLVAPIGVAAADDDGDGAPVLEPMPQGTLSPVPKSGKK